MQASLLAIDAALHDQAGLTPPGAAVTPCSTEALDAVFVELRERGAAVTRYVKVAADARQALADKCAELATVTAERDALLVAKTDLEHKLSAAQMSYGQLAARVQALEAAAQASPTPPPEAAPTPKG
jgi:3-dehydroquinate synthase class II